MEQQNHNKQPVQPLPGNTISEQSARTLPSGSGEGKAWTYITIILALILGYVVAQIVLESRSDVAPEEANVITEEMPEDEMPGTDATSETPEDSPVVVAVAEEAPMARTESTMMTSERSLVDVGGSTYVFDGIAWDFRDAGAEKTAVRIRFVNFRRDGVSIDVLPFRLGTHDGACRSVSDVRVTPAPGEKLLATARCFANGSGKEFVVTQEGHIVTTRYRVITSEGSGTAPLNQLSRIDITEIVQD